MVLNSSRTVAELGAGDLAARIVTVPATELARRQPGRPLPGAALLGGPAALTGVVSLPSVVASIRDRFAGAQGVSHHDGT